MRSGSPARAGAPTGSRRCESCSSSSSPLVRCAASTRGSRVLGCAAPARADGTSVRSRRAANVSCRHAPAQAPLGASFQARRQLRLRRRNSLSFSRAQSPRRSSGGSTHHPSRRSAPLRRRRLLQASLRSPAQPSARCRRNTAPGGAKTHAGRQPPTVCRVAARAQQFAARRVKKTRNPRPRQNLACAWTGGSAS